MDGNLAEFYPACHQIEDSSVELHVGIALPGAYHPDDAGVCGPPRNMFDSKLTIWGKRHRSSL